MNADFVLSGLHHIHAGFVLPPCPSSEADELEESGYVNFADLAHINRTLYKVDLANLEDDNRKLVGAGGNTIQSNLT